MTPENPTRSALRRYLLRQMSSDEREDFERRFFESDDFAAELMAAEEELIEDHESNRMDAASAKLFEELYLAEQSFREELNLHRSLRSLSRSPAADRTRGAGLQRIVLSVIAACLVFVAIGLMLMFRENRLLRQDVQSLQAKHLPQAQSVKPPVRSTEATPLRGSIPAILLQAATREASSQSAAIKLADDAIGFLLKADVNRYNNAGYLAAVQDIDGATLYQAGPLQGSSLMHGKVRVELFVPAARLTTGDYIMTVQNAASHQTLGAFYFRLLR